MEAADAKVNRRSISSFFTKEEEKKGPIHQSHRGEWTGCSKTVERGGAAVEDYGDSNFLLRQQQ